jgi:hypothetical protein
MAVKEATKTKKRAKQRSPELKGADGTETAGQTVAEQVQSRIPAIERLADELEEINSERGVLGARSKELKGKLVKVMVEHGIPLYRYDGKIVEHNHEESDEIKISPVKEKPAKQGGRTGQADFAGE